MSEQEAMAGMLRDAAQDFLAGRPERARLRGGTAHVRGVDRALWAEIAALGWTGVMLPEALDGMGLGLAEAAVLAETMGRELFAEPFVAAVVMPSVLLAEAHAEGDAAQAAPLAAALLDGSRLLTPAWQQRAGQVEPDWTACCVDDGRLTGCAAFVPDVGDDGALLVPATEAGRPVLVAVDLAAAGVVSESFGAGLGSQRQVRLDRAVLASPRPLLAGGAALQALARALSAGRIAHCAELAGMAAGCLRQTLEHVRGRQQFGRALGSFQSVQHRCVDLHIETMLSRASWQHALSQWAQAPDAAATEAAVSAAKARCGDAAVRIGRESVQMHGAMGFCEEVDIGLALRAALAGAAWLGSPDAHRRRFAEQTASTGVPEILQ